MASISGGDNIERVLSEILENASVGMNAGILSGATNEDTGELIAPYAAANEYGRFVKSKNGSYFQLPRPAFRNTVAEKSSEWGETFRKAMKSRTTEPESVRGAFTILGMIVVQDIRDTIEKSVPPPNAPSTVEAKRRKGRAAPEHTLVDSGSEQRAIDFEIIEGKDNEPA